MAILPVIGSDHWYETIRMSDGVTLIHEPWIKPFFRCNMWHVRGRDRDFFLILALAISAFVATCRLSRSVRLSALRATPISIISGAITNSRSAACTRLKRRSWPIRGTNGRWLTDMRPTKCSTAYRKDGTRGVIVFSSAPADRLLEGGDVVDLGDRAFEVIHTPATRRAA